MKIIEILPELEVGGVERHVVDLSNELAKRGHEVLVVSAGGRMQSELLGKVRHMCLPVHKKNPFTGYFCARKIATIVRQEKLQIIHAHSRVPAWIAWWVSSMAGIPFVITAHAASGNKTQWIYKPYRASQKVICVSRTVQEGMKECFYQNTCVVLNGLDKPKYKWSRPKEPPVKFLFVGRLSRAKGLQDVLRALPKEGGWTLDVLGEGPMETELKELVASLGISGKVTFHGYSDEVDLFMANSSCLLIPSYAEGFGLTLARAIQMGLPFLASDIDATRELVEGNVCLLSVGDVEAWKVAINKFIQNRGNKTAVFDCKRFEIDAMVDKVEQIYEQLHA